MAYSGNSLPIALGEIGLRTDAPMTSLPPNALIKANNVSLYAGKIEKARGSVLYSTVSLTSEIVSCIDWWPDSVNQRLIAMCANGKVYRDTGDRTWSGLATMNSIEVQRIHLNYPPTSGNVTLNFNGVNSTSIPYNASTAVLQTAIRTIPALVGAEVRGALASSDFIVLMKGTTGDQPMMTVSANTLVSRGSQTVSFTGGPPTAGSFVLNYYNGTATFSSTAIPYNASSLTVQNALRATDDDLSQVTVTGDFTTGFVISMVGFTNPPLLTVTNNTLVNGGTAMTIAVAPSGTVTITITEQSKGKTSLGALTTDAHMTQGGQEQSGAIKKLFLFTGTSQIQVVDADSNILRDIANPSPDWASGNYPTYGLIYQGRLCVFGCPTNPHQLYFSTQQDHENFLGDANGNPPPTYVNIPPTFAIFPGEGDKILTAIVYRGVLFLFKNPYGVYILDGSDPTVTNWTIKKYADSFGVQSPHSVLQVLTDLITANSFGSYTSLQASDAYGDFSAGDILANNQIEDYIRTIFNPAGLPYTSCIYYPEKKVAYFAGQSSSTRTSDQMLVLDVAHQTPRFTIDTKERPNCLALRRDAQKIQRPMYGDQSGFVWLFDQPSYNRNNQPYLGEFQTAYTDLGPEVAGKNKIFEFLEVNYVPTGSNSFSCDVFVDGEIRQTITFQQIQGSVLDDFVLDVDVLGGEDTSSRNRKALRSCTGNKISFRFYNNASNEGFKIERVIVGFRISAEQMYKGQK